MKVAGHRFFTETPDGLEYREAPPPWRVRLLFLGFGTMAFAIPVPFVLHAQWHVLSWTTLFAALCVVAPVALGLGAIALGLAPAQALRIDRRRGELVRTVQWVWGARRAAFALAEVEGVALHCNRHGDDGPTYQLVLRLRGRRPWTLGIWDDEAEAAHWRQRVAETVAP